MTDTHTDRRWAWTAFGVIGLTAGLLAAGAVPVAAQEMPTGPAAREVEAIACAPRGVTATPASLATVTGGVELKTSLFGAGNQIVLGHIGSEGLTVGSLYYLRRTAAPTVKGAQEDRWLNLATLGWVKVDRVDGAQAVATIVYSCDAAETGDFLMPFEVPAVPKPIPDSGETDFENTASMLFGPSRASTAGEGSLVVIDRGANHGLQAGRMVTIFRREGPTARVQVLGEGMVLVVLPESATIRVTKSVQPMYRGDFVAPRK